MVRESQEQPQTKIIPEPTQGQTPKEVLEGRGITFGIYPHKRDTSRLEPYRGQIEEVGYSALMQVAREMPILNVDVGVFDSPEYVIPELGIGAVAHGEFEGYPHSRVEIDLDPESPYKESAISTELARTIRHELHHDVREKHLGRDKTLRDRLILEGLAQHYEIEGTDEKPSIYATSLKPEEIPALLIRIEGDYGASGDIVGEWFFGAKDKGIPSWTGYTLGYHIVGEYLNAHPDQRASLLYAAPTEEFFK